MSDIPSAWLRPRVGLMVIPLLLIIAAAWSARHLYESYLAVLGGGGHAFAFLWTLTFFALVWHLALSWCERPFKTTEEEQEALDRLRVTLNVPVYNEDPSTLRTALRSVLNQSRPIQRVQVVNDGSTEGIEELAAIKEWWLGQQSLHPSSQLEWVDVPNQGKRHAQVMTFREDDADLFATMDSDTVLDRLCVEEGIKPFAQADITSVASVILAYNNRNWFVRLTDSWLLAFQLTVRGAMSTLGCVLVNSGNFSMYRADLIREAIPSYEHEFFCGNPVQFSDDSLLTLFAHLKGKTVQQPTSFAFTVLPATVGHHLRQQLRWMRGSTIRSIWRFRYLPVRGFAYWEHFVAWMNFMLISFAFAMIFVVAPLVGAFHITLLMLLFSLLVCYTVGIKYLTVARSDQGIGFQVVTLLMAPAMLVWTAVVLRPLRIYSIATCYRTGWGTRGKVEVET
jgi:hyaluronan synthase